MGSGRPSTRLYGPLKGQFQKGLFPVNSNLWTREFTPLRRSRFVWPLSGGGFFPYSPLKGGYRGR